MKILHVSNYYYPHIGGIETTARDCVNALKGQNTERVFCFHHKKSNCFDEVDGVPVTRAGSFLKVSSQSLSFSYHRLLKREMESFSPDVVIFHYPNPFAAHFLLKILKKRQDIKLILWWHLDITKQKILGKLFRGQSKRLLKRAEKVVSTSPNYVEGSPYLSSVREKCVIIPSCVKCSEGDEEKISARKEKILRENEGKILLFALGRHIPYKGMEYLVRASRLLDERFRVFIGGEGPLTKTLVKMARGDEKIRFLGKIDEEEKCAYLDACDIFCFPSVTKNEAFGLALAEAMAHGKCSVTFKIEGSGVNFVSLDNVTGLEVENANERAFAEAVKKLAADENLRSRLGQNARERVENNFTFEIFSQKVLNLLK